MQSGLSRPPGSRPCSQRCQRLVTRSDQADIGSHLAPGRTHDHPADRVARAGGRASAVAHPDSECLWPSNGPPNPGTVFLAIGVLFFIVAFWTAIIWGLTAALT